MNENLQFAKEKKVEMQREKGLKRGTFQTAHLAEKNVAEEASRERRSPVVKLPLVHMAPPVEGPPQVPELRLPRLKLRSLQILPVSVAQAEIVSPLLVALKRTRLAVPALLAPVPRAWVTPPRSLRVNHSRLCRPPVLLAGRTEASLAPVPLLRLFHPPFRRLATLSAEISSVGEAVTTLKPPSPAGRGVKVEAAEPVSVLNLEARTPKLVLPHGNPPTVPFGRPPKVSALAAQPPMPRLRTLVLRTPLFSAPGVLSNAVPPRISAPEALVRLGKIPVEGARTEADAFPASAARAEINIPMLPPRAGVGEGLKAAVEDRGGSAPSAGLLEAEEGKLTAEKLYIPQFIDALSEASSSPHQPVVIVVPKVKGDSLVSAVAIACREIYRVVKGGKPEPRWISAASMKEEVERYLSAEDRIFVIDDQEGRLFSTSRVQTIDSKEARIDLQVLLDRLRELFSQDFGFVIFHVREEIADSVYETLKGLHLGARIVKVEPPRGWVLEDKRRFVEACWGFVEVEGQSIDGMFKEAEEKFLDELRKIRKNIAIAHWIERDESASEEHESLKVFVAECLARELGYKSEREMVEALKNGIVRTEYEFGGARADIYVPSQQRFVEVETFYGTRNPFDKLKEVTLSKYIRRASRVDVVILNGFLAILYARTLMDLARIYREDHGIAVNFYIPNFKELRLVHLKEFLTLLRNIKKLIK